MFIFTKLLRENIKVFSINPFDHRRACLYQILDNLTFSVAVTQWIGNFIPFVKSLHTLCLVCIQFAVLQACCAVLCCGRSKPVDEESLGCNFLELWPNYNWCVKSNTQIFWYGDKFNGASIEMYIELSSVKFVIGVEAYALCFGWIGYQSPPPIVFP